jgi:hypothetical protein
LISSRLHNLHFLSFRSLTDSCRLAGPFFSVRRTYKIIYDPACTPCAVFSLHNISQFFSHVFCARDAWSILLTHKVHRLCRSVSPKVSYSEILNVRRHLTLWFSLQVIISVPSDTLLVACAHVFNIHLIYHPVGEIILKGFGK